MCSVRLSQVEAQERELEVEADKPQLQEEPEVKTPESKDCQAG
jgi:hypothetical protein